MLFNSFAFIFAFLPVTIAGYFILNRLNLRKVAKAFLLLASLFFYGYLNPLFLIVILSSILINYGFYILFRKKAGTVTLRKVLLAIALILNVGALVTFKYMPGDIIFPLGISFITFRQVAFCVDSYRGDVKVWSLPDYALSVSFFPAVVSGPLMGHGDLIDQLNDEERKKFNINEFAAGTVAFILGLSKKILLAEVFGRVVDYSWTAIDYLRPFDVIVGATAYYLQIYFDFSGYSDMAIGVGRMLGITIPENFDSPYKAVTIRDYWKRWHMTLTDFLTRYIYIPLGGSRHGVLRTYLNTVIVFIISGIWHGKGLGFVVWGLSGGIGIVLCRIFEKPINRLKESFFATCVMWVVNFCYIAFFWIFFRAGNIGDSVRYISHLKPGAEGFGFPHSILSPMFETKEVLYALKLLHIPEVYHDPLLAVSYMLIGFAIILFVPNVSEITGKFKPGRLWAVILALLLIWSLINFSGVATYIYFKF